MKRTWLYLFLLSLLFLSNCIDSKKGKKELKTDTAFSLLNSDQSGINFTNKISESNKLSILDYEYFYNGAGVGIADFDGDGLLDIFFGGNQASDRLYKNTGDMHFEDITKEAGIDHNGWTIGVSIVDINYDGLPDIYLSRSGPVASKRMNALYINEGSFKFTEQAYEYGLDIDAPSNQTSFFDYDKDGDLDAYMITHPTNFTDTYNISELLSAVDRGEIESDILLKNENGFYVDATKEAGIVEYGHTLGMVISDLNNDGWPDIFATNDFHKPDVLYVNNHKGGFFNVANLAFKHTSNNSMGCDIADINNDGFMDVSTMDMNFLSHYRSKTNMPSMSTEKFNAKVELGWNYQYMSNTLQINTGKGSFSDVAQLAGVHQSDWSWSTLLVDLNGDNAKELFITNGYKRDLANNDLVDIQNKANAKEKMKSIDDYLKNIPQTLVNNFVFENTGQLHYENVSIAWGFEKGMHSHGAAYGDLDNDGDLDLVINNVDSKSVIFENNLNPDRYVKVQVESMDEYWLNARTYCLFDNDTLLNELQPIRGYASSMAPEWIYYPDENQRLPKVLAYTLSDGNTYEMQLKEGLNVISDNDPPSSFNPNRKYSVYINDAINNAGVQFNYKENTYDDFAAQRLLPHKVSVAGPYVSNADINNNGSDELFISSSTGNSALLCVQNSVGGINAIQLDVFKNDKKYEDEGAVFIDVNKDGLKDLFVSSGGGVYNAGNENNADRLYINTGDGDFKKQTIKNSSFVNGGTAIVGDFNKDGNDDVLVAGRVSPNQYPLPAPFTLWQGNGKTLNEVNAETIFPTINSLGMIQDLVFIDLNKDGLKDLICTGHWMGVEVFYANNSGFDPPKSLITSKTGWFNTLEVSDVNNDGFLDIVIGNEGMNNKYKAAEKKPLKIYAADFDNSGTHDIVLAKNEGDLLVPVRGRECSIEQVPEIQTALPSFEEFATSTLDEIYSNESLNDAYFAQVNEFRHAILYQDQGGSFTFTPLPHESQISPIMDWELIDLNHDGLIDIIGVGNRYNTEVETSRGDAGTGLVLLQEKNGDWKSLSPLESGLYNPNNARSITLLSRGDGLSYFIGNNNGPFKVIDVAK